MKKIIFCADGTWNGVNEDDNNDGSPDYTNVYKIFLNLEGDLSAASSMLADEQEKVLQENGETVQIAKYIHGVGDSKNWLYQALGGVFGAGMIQRIVRGYTFISRNYQPGDEIYLIGFSRGAYTVRALAGLITSQGLLDSNKYDLQDDKKEAYRLATAVWANYRKEMIGNNKDFLGKLKNILVDLPFFASRNITEISRVNNIPIKVVAVWDTVGALGIPEYHNHDRRVDALRFTDTQLSSMVKYGRHAISIDEQRIDFTPTLWQERQHIIQVLFPGAHADVGGGYTETESGLSNGAYCWMRQELTSFGLRFSTHPHYAYTADPHGVSHSPWFSKKYIWNVATRGLPSCTVNNGTSPTLPSEFIGVHSSVVSRLANPPESYYLDADTIASRTYNPTALGSYLAATGGLVNNIYIVP